MLTSFEQLVEQSLLVRTDFSETLETTGFVSYAVADNTVLLTPAQRNDQLVRVNYVQLCKDDEGFVWVAQLEAFPEDPNNCPRNTEFEVEVYKLVC